MFQRSVSRIAMLACTAIAVHLVAAPAQAQQGWPINGDNWSTNGGSGGSSSYAPSSSSTGQYAAPATAYYSNYGDYSVPQTAPGVGVVGTPYYAPGQAVSSYQSFYNAGTSGDRPALINVRVPAQAQLWIDDVPMNTTTGAFRQFQSQPLEPGYRYSYHVRARWMENGRSVERSQKVRFRAGEQADVNLLRQSGGGS